MAAGVSGSHGAKVVTSKVLTAVALVAVALTTACATVTNRLSLSISQQAAVKNFLDRRLEAFAESYDALRGDVVNPYFLRPNPGVDPEDDATVATIAADNDVRALAALESPGAQAATDAAGSTSTFGPSLALTRRLNLNLNLFRYAHFCGPGWPEGLEIPNTDDPRENQRRRGANIARLRSKAAEKPPFDDIDYACFAHDYCYEAVGRNVEVCDYAMMATMLSLASTFRDEAAIAMAFNDAAVVDSAMECANLTLDMALAFYVKPRQGSLLDFVVAAMRLYTNYARIAGEEGEAFLERKFQEQRLYGFPLGAERCQIEGDADDPRGSGLDTIAVFESFANGASLNVKEFVTPGIAPESAGDDDVRIRMLSMVAGRFNDVTRRAATPVMTVAETGLCTLGRRQCGPPRLKICVEDATAGAAETESPAERAADDATADDAKADDTDAAVCAAADEAAVVEPWTRVRRRMRVIGVTEATAYLALQ